MVHHTLFRCLWPGAARSTRTVLVSTSAGGRSGGSRLLTLSPVGRGWSLWQHMASLVWTTLLSDHLCLTASHQTKGLLPMSDLLSLWNSASNPLAGGLDPQRRERVKYVNQTFTYFSIIVWIHNLLLCKMIFCCSLIGGASLPSHQEWLQTHYSLKDWSLGPKCYLSECVEWICMSEILFCVYQSPDLYTLPQVVSLF